MSRYIDAEYTLEICTNRLGSLIGMMSTRVDNYRDLISEKIKHRAFVKFIETVEII